MKGGFATRVAGSADLYKVGLLFVCGIIVSLYVVFYFLKLVNTSTPLTPLTFHSNVLKFFLR